MQVHRCKFFALLITGVLVILLTIHQYTSESIFEYHSVVREAASFTGYYCQRQTKMDEILHFYNRTSWWDEMLCKNSKENLLLSSVPTILPLQKLYRDVHPNEHQSENIFFVENNCQPKISFYVQCALESAAHQNPRSKVFLLVVIPFLEDGSNIIQNLLERFSNIQIVQADYDEILKDTPLDSFRSIERWTKRQEFVKSHLSDAVRTAIVWKEGGTYMDTDIISLKELLIHENSLALEFETLHSCFIRATKHHPFLWEIMKHQNSSYDGNWISLGPAPITSGANAYSNTTIKKAGMYQDVAVLPFEAFNPISWQNTYTFFKPHPETNLRQIINESYGIHTSHYMSGERLNELGKENLYDQITKEFCPFSYKQHSS